MNDFVAWVDEEGGIWNMVMHGWTEADLIPAHMTIPQLQVLGRIKHHILEANRLWQELEEELAE